MQPPIRNGRAPPTVRQPDPLPANKRQFLLSVLEVVVRQLQWPSDVDWEIVQENDNDMDDDIAAFYAMRKSFRSTMDNIAAIEKSLHTEVVANIVVNTLERLRSQGIGAVSWQEAELAAYLVHTFGEISKSNTRAAFWNLPAELVSKTAIKGSRGGQDAAMSSGQTTPTGEVSLDPNGKIDYEQFPLTPLGQLLTLCMSSGLAAYPHPSVQLLFFEISVRYIDFWKAKPGAIQPIFESLLDHRGIHHSVEGVRRRAFYLLSRLIKECRIEMEPSMIPIILEALKDMLTITPVLPEADTEEDVLLKATNTKSYFQDQLHLFEAAGILVYLTRSDPASQMNFLAAIAGPLMTGIGAGLEQYRQNPSDPLTVLSVHHHLLALGHFAKGFPHVSDGQIDAQPYQQPFKQMTEALLEALSVMKTQRIIRDSVSLKCCIRN
jgi:exportin-T